MSFDVVGGFFAGGSALPVGVGAGIGSGHSERYYDAYDKYLQVFSDAVGNYRSSGAGVSQVGGVTYVLAPPAWVCGTAVEKGSEFGGSVDRVTDGGAVPAVLLQGSSGEGVVRDGVYDGVESVARVCGGAGAVERDDRVVVDGQGGCGEVKRSQDFDEQREGCVATEGRLRRGKNYEKNKVKRERVKAMKANVRDLKDVCPSLTGSVCTVDTRTAEEIEAVRTLAARRVAENKVARRMAELKLISLNNKDKTDAVLRLEAARMEQRINEAKAKSQASFKECDTSLKSLGSTGSAGEFALKQEVKRGRDNEIRLKYAQLQNDYMIKHVPEHVRQVILDMPEPVFEHDAEVFGECPEDYDDEQRMAYDIEMNSRAAGVQY